MDQRTERHEGKSVRIIVVDTNRNQGYWNNDKATRESLTEDRWLKTGDIAFADKEGYLTFTDRKKELIKYKVSDIT